MTGTERTYSGQEYTCVGVEPYRRRDGTETMLLVWQSHCAKCGEPFQCRTPVAAKVFAPSRRCGEHKQPGKRVRARKAQ